MCVCGPNCGISIAFHHPWLPYGSAHGEGWDEKRARDQIRSDHSLHINSGCFDSLPLSLPFTMPTDLEMKMVVGVTSLVRRRSPTQIGTVVNSLVSIHGFPRLDPLVNVVALRHVALSCVVDQATRYPPFIIIIIIIFTITI